MRVAITGGAGNIGRHVCRAVSEAGQTPVCVDRGPPAEEGEHAVVDLCDAGQTLRALESVEAVVHFAAIPDPFSDPAEEVMGVNTMTALNVFDAVRRHGIGRVVYGCSESCSGFGIHNVSLKPRYVSIDEDHPCRPRDSWREFETWEAEL